MAIESRISTDRRCIFREVFTPNSIAKNGGVITGGVTLSNGVATFDGVAGTKILYPRRTFNKDFSVRIRFSREGHPVAREDMVSYNGNLQFFRLETTGHLGGHVRSSDPVTVLNLISSIDVCDGQMHEAVFSLQYGGNTRFFIDGVVYSDTSFVFTGVFDLIGLYMGAYNLGREFGGGLELVEIYDSALTAEECNLLFNNRLYAGFVE